MSLRRIPVFPTLLVLAAIGVMIALGFWQLDRMHQKDALLARYAVAKAMSAEVRWSGDPVEGERLLYRYARVNCAKTERAPPVAGRNASGEVGWAQVQTCRTPEGFSVKLIIGWAKEPNAGEFAPGLVTRWQGGAISGVIGPGPRLVVNPPVKPLQANGLPDPADIPNNHLSYAVQWFLFAATALVIYAIALRKRLRAQ